MEKGELILLGIIGAVGGAITALCLRSFTTTLPALAIGGIISAGAFAVLFAFIAIDNYLKEKSFSKDDILLLFAMCATSVAIGVGITAALTPISPEIFAKWNTAIVAGAAIGAIGLAVGWLATDFVVLPMIEKIGKCFSSEKPDSSVDSTNVTEGGLELRTVNP